MVVPDTGCQMVVPDAGCQYGCSRHRMSGWFLQMQDGCSRCGMVAPDAGYQHGCSSHRDPEQSGPHPHPSTTPPPHPHFTSMSSIGQSQQKWKFTPSGWAHDHRRKAPQHFHLPPLTCQIRCQRGERTRCQRRRLPQGTQLLLRYCACCSAKERAETSLPLSPVFPSLQGNNEIISKRTAHSHQCSRCYTMRRCTPHPTNSSSPHTHTAT